MTGTISDLQSDIAGCDICKDRFAATKTRHAPRPVVWFEKGARILIAGQAPGAKVHESGVPFQDRSGDRLREWMGLDASDFYDRSLISIVPMAFCFPGYSAKGADLPPPPICAKTWRARAMGHLNDIRLTLLIGGHAQKWHLQATARSTVTQTVKNWRERAPYIIPLPHPSWRNTAWINANPWFETELIPVLRTQVQKALS